MAEASHNLETVNWGYFSGVVATLARAGAESEQGLGRAVRLLG